MAWRGAGAVDWYRVMRPASTCGQTVSASRSMWNLGSLYLTYRLLLRDVLLVI
jgi:hypothetical protein